MAAAVETAITLVPSHRFQRAVFLHWALKRYFASVIRVLPDFAITRREVGLCNLNLRVQHKLSLCVRNSLKKIVFSQTPF